MNKSSHAKQFLLPGCECYCNAAHIPFDRYALIPRSRPRRLSSAPWWCLTVPVPVRSGLQDMSTIPRSASMYSISLDGLLLNIPSASVHTFRWGGVPPAVSNLVYNNLRSECNAVRSFHRKYISLIRSIFNLLILVCCFCKSDSPEILVNHW